MATAHGRSGALGFACLAVVEATDIAEGASGPRGGGRGRYRLRVGEFRVLFALEKDLLLEHQVKDRKNAYRD